MPIIKKYNLLFLHIPKTGGTSIENFFNVRSNSKEESNKNLWDYGHFYDLYSSNYIPTKWDRDNISFLPQQWTPKYLKEYLKEDYNNYFKFLFVRNPYTKLISEFYSNPFNSTNRMEEFNEWLPFFLKSINHVHKIPQSEYLDSSINFIGRYENFQNDFSSLILNLGLNIDSTLPKHNVSHNFNKESLIPLISKSNLDLINTVYEKDFINFGYEFV